MNSKKIETGIFRKHQVVLAYLFGSRTKHTATKASDYDIAAVFKHKNGSSGFLRKTFLLKEALREHFPKEVDIVALNDAGSLLKYEVVAHGKPIYSENEKFRLAFEVLAAKEYIDDQYMRDIYTTALSKRVRKGTYV